MRRTLSDPANRMQELDPRQRRSSAEGRQRLSLRLLGRLSWSLGLPLPLSIGGQHVNQSEVSSAKSAS
jgi:hypothetical protein